VNAQPPPGLAWEAPATHRRVTRRLRRSLAVLALGILGPATAITLLALTGTEDGPVMAAGMATLPVGLFLVLSHPLRIRDARRTRSVLRRSRWVLVATDHAPDATDPTGLLSIVRATPDDGPPMYWRIDDVGVPAWTGWAWLAEDPDGERGVLSPCDPTDLVTVRRLADADELGSWAAASATIGDDGDGDGGTAGPAEVGATIVIRRLAIYGGIAVSVAIGMSLVLLVLGIPERPGRSIWDRPVAIALGILILVLFVSIATWKQRRRRFANPDAVHDVV
jgi:hypothetical protein